MNNKSSKIVGIIPAAGNASRISPLPCSKEIFPVGFRTNVSQETPRIKVAASYLLESFCEAGADQIYMIIQKGKWDIPQYFGMGTDPEYSLAYLVTESTKGTHYTIDLAHRFVKDKMILLGFPDILFKPNNAFVSLLEKQEQTGADVVLGLFKTENPHKADMVDIDEQGRVRKIVIKPRRTKLEFTWTIAVWTPDFSNYLHNFVTERGIDKGSKSIPQREIFIGDVILHALEHGLDVETVLFPDGEYIDIGTLPDLKKALSREL
ncbi:sugar phosphate nucleotidyltransferase [Aliifodinibius sp. S!AR15-10]|uniref:sugar phosphate nucleotidyltransferase n=1 Tax=Aliifodinibius sp. S!AR15-10 TaxID=2950437 RepID=UPI00285C5402|nr:sugar phosphate nucleotidyltransferase [Aliifodinibius sp. S!AR15-10]MDR8390230.1 sugar phosphate nucleotidyltransferase [Aliifodinibius sp. S!AR15-10]